MPALPRRFVPARIGTEAVLQKRRLPPAASRRPGGFGAVAPKRQQARRCRWFCRMHCRCPSPLSPCPRHPAQPSVSQCTVAGGRSTVQTLSLLLPGSQPPRGRLLSVVQSMAAHSYAKGGEQVGSVQAPNGLMSRKLPNRNAAQRPIVLLQRLDHKACRPRQHHKTLWFEALTLKALCTQLCQVLIFPSDAAIAA